MLPERFCNIVKNCDDPGKEQGVWVRTVKSTAKSDI